MACAICGFDDPRGVTESCLSSGVRVTLCGTHALMHQRLGSPARSEGALRVLFGDRRAGCVDRRRGGGDELAMALHVAFAGERRRGDRRTV